MKPLLVTVHGINTRGKWQDDMEVLFGPFFDCIAIKYPYYRRLGALKILIEPWVAFSAIIIAIILIQQRIVAATWYAFISIGAATTISGYLAARFRRELALRTFKLQLDKGASTGRYPNAIAHSWGTFLVGASLLRYPNVSFGSIIFTGCVLKRDYGWEWLFRNNSHACVQALNEVAAKDDVVRLAYCIRHLVRGLGDAGVAGFISPLAHWLNGPYAPCYECVNGRQVQIHNVEHPEMDHGDPYVGDGHAETFWLPFLFGIECEEYREFVETCLAIAYANEQRNLPALEAAQRALRETYCSWAKATLEQFIEDQIRRMTQKNGRYRQTHDEVVADRVDTAVMYVWTSVAKAKSRRGSGKMNSRQLNTMRVLYPPTAVGQAVQRSIRRK